MPFIQGVSGKLFGATLVNLQLISAALLFFSFSCGKLRKKHLKEVSQDQPGFGIGPRHLLFSMPKPP